MSIRVASIVCGVAGSVLLSMMAAGADENNKKAPEASVWTQAPAVDDLNAKIDGFGGSLANKSVYGSRGSLAFPLGGQYGAQIDGAAGSFDSRFFGNVGGHLFWRDPAKGLVGVYSDYTDWKSRIGGVNVGRFAGEGEYYFGRWTLRGLAGVETGNSVTGIIGSNIQTYNIKTRFFDAADVAYYLQDNLKLFVGHRYQGGKNSLALGSEWGFPVSGGTMGALFAEGRIGSGNNHGIWAGLRFYFGQKNKTLIRRNREDDPVGSAPDPLGTMNTNGSTTPNTPNPPNCCPVDNTGGLILLPGTKLASLADGPPPGGCVPCPNGQGPV
jgi:hypothetical protein